jgi:hypothetical protein
MAKGKSGGGSRSSGEQTGSKAASLAAKGLAGGKLTPSQQKTVYASALTQTPPSKKK